MRIGGSKLDSSPAITSDPEDQAAIRVENLVKEFRRRGGETVLAVDKVSLDIEPGEMVVILGPSGCGKTTFLRCIAGLEAPSGGSIWSGGRLLSGQGKGIVVPPERRGFGMMFQNYAVWPHMSVVQNVAYSLKSRGRSKSEIQARVSEILDLVGIKHLGDEYPTGLSGGQQQRVALARSLVADPNVVLFDEPLSNVDAKVREELRVELLLMQKRIGFAGVYVTHDQEEAMAMADRIVVMKEGTAVQVGPPREVYGAPKSRFVARFVGMINEWIGTVTSCDPTSEQIVVRTEAGNMRIAKENVAQPVMEGDSVAVIVRPEQLSVMVDKGDSTPGTETEGAGWQGALSTVMFCGAHCNYFVESGGYVLRARASGLNEIGEGEDVYVTASPQDLRAIKVGDPDSDDDRPRDFQLSSQDSGVYGQDESKAS